MHIGHAAAIIPTIKSKLTSPDLPVTTAILEIRKITPNQSII